MRDTLVKGTETMTRVKKAKKRVFFSRFKNCNSLFLYLDVSKKSDFFGYDLSLSRSTVLKMSRNL